MSSGKINLFGTATEKQTNTLSSNHSAVATALVSAAPSALIEDAIHAKRKKKWTEMADEGYLSLSSSRSNTVDFPADSPFETDPPREEPVPLLSLEPSGPGACGK
jgi:hypothetical protein